VEIGTLQAQQTLFVRQRITLMVNRYEVLAANSSGSPGPMVAFAEQKRMTLREQVTLFTDATKSSVLAAFKARQVIDIGATYDVTDASGAPIGQFRKDFARSLLRSTWHLEQPGVGTITGQERNIVVALLRRFGVDFLPYHFDFAQNGRPDFSVARQFAIRDSYQVTISNPAVDRRLVIAMAVALDALQAR
jgi:uncharacterized protein YxjI